MPTISFDKLSKSFGSTTVITEFEAEVPDNEFLVLLGPSGCGKSTMLRMIAGLIDITSGELRFDGRRVNELEPKERNIAFVFQSYALYPHMTVRANIAFPLLMNRFRWWHHIPIVSAVSRRRFMWDAEIAAKVDHIAEMMELTDYLDRRPRTLSGGQRQRVAVARSLVRDPTIYLLDEPLSNLDAKLRTQMRAEISALYQRVRKSFVYVTHDQVEAMTMGTRIIVLDQGVVQQYGTPAEIYDRPANTFVARFIGSPAMNLMGVDVTSEGIDIPGAAVLAFGPGQGRPAPGRVLLGVRAEKISIEKATAKEGIAAHVTVVEHLGAETVLGFKFGPATDNAELGEAASRDLHYARLPGTVDIAPGADCRVVFDMASVSWFDVDSGARLEVAADVVRTGP